MKTMSQLKVKIDIMEWYEDDVGQYDKDGLPRELNEFVVSVSSADNEVVGEKIMHQLEVQYQIRPVLVEWDKIGA